MKLVLMISIALMLQLIILPDTLQAEDASEQVTDIRSRKTGKDWPTFLGPHGNSKSDETGIIKPWPESGLPIAWQKEIAEGYGAPSIAKGRLFLFDRAGGNARLTCMNSETGEEIWTFEYQTDYEDIYGFSNGPRTAPVIENERVYIFGVEGMMHCLNVEDGSVIWKLDTQKTFDVVQNFFGVGSTPVIEGDLLISAIGGSLPTEYANVFKADGKLTGNGSGIVAFNKFTGEIVYKSSNELASYASPKIVDMNGRRQGIWFARGGLMGFSPQTGEVNFHYPWRAVRLESVNASNPAIMGNLVFISESYEFGSSVLKIETDDYSLVWKDEKRSRNKAMALHWTTAIPHDGYLYACHGKNAGAAMLRCIEFETGKIVWSHKIKELSSLLYVDGHFISMGERGTLILFKATSDSAEIVSTTILRDESGESLLQYPSWPAPVISNGFLYLRGKDRLICVDLLGI